MCHNASHTKHHHLFWHQQSHMKYHIRCQALWCSSFLGYVQYNCPDSYEYWKCTSARKNIWFLTSAYSSRKPFHWYRTFILCASSSFSHHLEISSERFLKEPKVVPSERRNPIWHIYLKKKAVYVWNSMLEQAFTYWLWWHWDKKINSAPTRLSLHYLEANNHLTASQLLFPFGYRELEAYSHGPSHYVHGLNRTLNMNCIFIVILVVYGCGQLKCPL